MATAWQPSAGRLADFAVITEADWGSVYSMSIPEDLFALSETAARVRGRLHDEVLEGSLAAIRTVGEEAKRAWSGSNIGYHATVYYAGLEPHPPGAQFSPEWGLMDVWP